MLKILLIEKIDPLRTAFRYVKERRPFHVNAVVIMPDQSPLHLDIAAKRR